MQGRASCKRGTDVAHAFGHLRLIARSGAVRALPWSRDRSEEKPEKTQFFPKHRLAQYIGTKLDVSLALDCRARRITRVEMVGEYVHCKESHRYVTSDPVHAPEGIEMSDEPVVEPGWLGLAEAMRLTGASRGTVRRWVRDGLIEARSLPGARAKLRRSDVMELLEKSTRTKRTAATPG